ncbi:signal peptidase I [Candidatus Shapirobacteria bacterium]|nr:signal peptidase I [Candidatus Shapirobacteria bacterium]
MLKKIFFFFVDTIQSLVFAASIFILLYLFVAQPNQVNGRSMMPGFEDKSLLLTDKVSYRFRKPQRGDVVVFKAPPSEPCAEDECEYIKRVIGLPGEMIKVQDQKVYVNGQLLIENYLPDDFATNPGGYFSESREIIIPENQYALFGDNRSHSRDSREFGPITLSFIVGKALFIYWPLSESGLIPAVSY